MFEALGRVFGKIAAKGVSSLARVMRFRSEQLKDMREETAVRSIDPEAFRTPLFQDAAQRLRDQLANSPESLSEYVQTIHEEIGGALTKALDQILNPPSVTTPEEARAHLDFMVALGLDVTLLIGILDIVATAFSATMVRNLVHIAGLILGVLGFSAATPLAIGTALDSRMRPLLTRYYNEQAKALIPSQSDLVTMELREVFRDKERAEQLQPPPSDTFVRFMAELGFDKYWADSYWAAHWNLPGISLLNEMVHRDIISEETWETFVKRNDFLPALIPSLRKVIYALPTRVDIRRMWQLGAADDKEVEAVYRGQGYAPEVAHDLLLFTKLERSLPEIRARYGKGWIGSVEVKGELQAIGLKGDKLERVFQTIVKEEKPKRTESDKDLTKAEIVKGVKKDVITYDQGLMLLQRWGLDADEAAYVLAINIEALSGSPESELEFRRLVEGQRRADGLDAVDIPDSLLEAERAVRELEQKIAAERETTNDDAAIDRLEADLEVARYRYDQARKQASLD